MAESSAGDRWHSALSLERFDYAWRQFHIIVRLRNIHPARIKNPSGGQAWLFKMREMKETNNETARVHRTRAVSFRFVIAVDDLAKEELIGR